MDSVEYVVRRSIPGAIAECGVWRGGAVLAMILTLQRLNATDRHIYLLDTFEGMTRPDDVDTSPFGRSAADIWQEAQEAGDVPWEWFFDPDLFGLQHVQQLIMESGYPRELVHFVVGPVEETLPERAPSELAILRLDTDWYGSTKHELTHLYPRLSSGGVLIVDDYGHWDGCRKAVDEYFTANPPTPLLARTDYTARIAVKP